MCRYCDPSYAFPSQKDVIHFAVQTSLRFLQTHPGALVVVGSYTIGKERLFHGMLLVMHCFACFKSVAELLL